MPVQKAPFTIQSRNSTAVNIIRSWLKAVQIPVSMGSDCDLVVSTKTGDKVRVVVDIDAQSLFNDQNLIRVQASEFTGKRVTVALEAFWRITDKAGYERKKPMDRGEGPRLNERGNPRKLHYKDNPFDVAIRHTEFRRSVNPPISAWAQYKPTMERVAYRFYHLNSHLCRRNGLEINDLFQYARCWIVNFCTRYECANPTHFDNERKLHRYLQQRFRYDLQPLLSKQERSVLPDKESVRVALFDDPMMDMESSMHPDDAQRIKEMDYGYISRNCQLDTSSMAARRTSANAKLEELLGDMDHDDMIETLQNATQNSFFDPSARKEAERRLRDHNLSCEVCIQPLQEIDSGMQQQADMYDMKYLPQADLLPLLRKILATMAAGETKTKSLAVLLNVKERAISFYRSAAYSMGFIDKNTVTDSGAELVGADSIKKEKDLFMAAIMQSKNFRVFNWYFKEPKSDFVGLVNFIMASFENRRFGGGRISRTTAERRGKCLRSWKKYLEL